MGFARSEVIESLSVTKNIPAAMVRYISRNGCNGFRCRECPLGLVCDHYPVHSQEVALKVISEVSRHCGK